MKLDTTTIVVISVIVDFILVLILIHTWRTRTTYPGFVAWIAGTACWSLGSLLAILLSAMHPQFIPKIIGNSLIMLHSVLLYEGIERFHGIRRRWSGTLLNCALLLGGILNQLYFFYISENIAVRTAGISIVLAIIFARISLEPLFYARIRRYSMQWLLSTCLLPLVALLVARAWANFPSSPVETLSAMVAHDKLLQWVIFYGIFAELIIAYSYLSLTSDRVEDELRAEKRKLMKTIQVSDQYQCQLQDLNSRIREQAEVQERFLDMVSHEYRTPLAIIQTNIDIMELKEQRAGGTISGSLNKIQLAVDRLIDVFEATRSRKEFETITVEPLFEEIVVWSSLKETLDSATEFFGKRFIYLDEPPADCTLYGDRRLLQTVLFNLLENAVKYTPPDLPITLQIVIKGDQLELSICNHPSTPLADEPELLFQKFRRGRNSTGTSGTGQGLYLARGIVEQHGGSLKLMLDDSGDVVTIMRLPLATPTEES